MSSGAQVAVLEPRGVRRQHSRTDPRPLERPHVRLAAFTALALYGALRWGTLLTPVPTWRLVGEVALAASLAGIVRPVALRSRLAAALLAAAAIVVMLALSGLPLSWLVHARLAVAARAVGQGLSALPHVLVPYRGINEAVRTVVVLGCGVLLLDAALMFCFAPSRISEAWRAGAALPLVVLAVLPSTLARPELPYLHGLILFGLLMLFVWSDRIRRFDLPGAAGVGVLAAAVAMVAAPALDPHHPWLNYESLAANLAPANLERFDWTQRYGPLNWPRTGREVMDVRAARPDYWKAEDLNVFDGRAWVAGSAPSAQRLPSPDPPALVRWSQTIKVTLRNMQSTDVIGAGVAGPPQHLAQTAQPGTDAGTWTAQSMLQPGDSYTITTYSPRPGAAALARAGRDYPDDLLAGYRSMLLPGVGASPGPALVFPPFHSPAPAQRIVGIYGANGAALLDGSPYRRAYLLARRLAAGAATPYGFVDSVLGLLRHGYRYDENPPTSRYPLERFLFADRRGYCQQFSGAMTLLLRMGGLPARVSAGFTSGSYDQAEHRWVVGDLDAHAWVEVWFPHFGWVRFDPTPAAAPARSTPSVAPNLPGKPGAPPRVSPGQRRDVGSAPSSSRATHPGGGGSPGWIPLLLSAMLLLGGLVVLGLRRRAPYGEDGRIAELERALVLCGRSCGGLTLAGLEHRIGASSPAAEYVRALRLARFAGAGVVPSAAARRAFRRYLRAGLGPLGWFRAWWALPPAFVHGGRLSAAPRRA